MRFMLAATLVLVIIITVVDAGRRHRVRNGIRRRYSYGRQLFMWRRYHQRRTLKQISCNQIRRSQVCSRCCAVDGNWRPWSDFNSCSVTCGNGTQSRSRTCDNPAPVYGGADCHGDGNETRSCNTMINCPVDGNWGTWSEFSTCCSVCGVEQKRSRVCDNPPPEIGGANCPGGSVEIRSCDSNDCLDNVSSSLCANQSLEVLVAVDVSANITDEEVGQERDLLQKLYSELRIDGIARRFGFVAHGGAASTSDLNILTLGSGTTATQKLRISQINKLGGMPLLNSALYVIINDFEYYGRPGIRRIAIVIKAAETTPIRKSSSFATGGTTDDLIMYYTIGIGAINTGSSQLNETATQLERLICFCDK
ncbi:coadhesin isoform X2 [Patella vulgata]|uniref:coadhesin isoform X2 n=1 Tax=Patella vulgata TaxID=6465 RepID=UPI00218006F1|nr:coadhesin isoform X2 [Patella vulgata]